MRRSVWMALPALLVFLAAGCGEDKPRPRPTPATPPPRAAQPEVELEAPEEEPEFVYSPVGKRDPFRSPFADKTQAGGAGAETERPLTPLQRWNLEQLTVRAIITGTSTPMAMVVDPEGQGHTVSRGTLIGKNWGRVTAIRRDCIVITEQSRDATQAVVPVRQERCLPQTEREAEFEEALQQ